MSDMSMGGSSPKKGMDPKMMMDCGTLVLAAGGLVVALGAAAAAYKGASDLSGLSGSNGPNKFGAGLDALAHPSLAFVAVAVLIAIGATAMGKGGGLVPIVHVLGVVAALFLVLGALGGLIIIGDENSKFSAFLMLVGNAALGVGLFGISAPGAMKMMQK